MIVSAAIKRKYDFYKPYLEALANNIDMALHNFCRSKGFAYTSRIKTLESLSEKIETGRFANWDSLDDLFAATIIIPNQNFEEDVVSFLGSAYETIKVKKKGSTLKSPDVFRFDSTRFIGRLKVYDEANKQPFTDIPFEVQIKTAFEHAWSVATHSLSYKTNVVDWKILRLTAQLKSSVEQLDMLVSGAKNINEFIQESKWPEVETKKFILDKFLQLKELDLIPDELLPKDGSRFCDNLLNIIKLNPIFSNKETEEVINSSFEIIKTEITTYSKHTFPRSLSLLQLFTAILYKHSKIKANNDSYIPVVTNEMEMLFPETKKISVRFNIGE